MKAFVPPGWVAQEALRLELYRRISLAGDHETLEGIRAETIDRYGALPEQVETLFGMASLRITARRLGVEEVSTYRDQVRMRPCRSSMRCDSTWRSVSRSDVPRGEADAEPGAGARLRSPISSGGWRRGSARPLATPCPSVERPAGRLPAPMCSLLSSSMFAATAPGRPGCVHPVRLRTRQAGGGSCGRAGCRHFRLQPPSRCSACSRT